MSTEIPRPEEILRQVFGYAEFRPLQGEIVHAVTAGEDRLAIMPTGAGKSLCYQIPAMARAGTGLVISPLVALMQDQVRALTEAGVNAAALTAASTDDERMRAWHGLDDGSLDLLYVAPERATMPVFQERLANARLSLIAIDEAHCVSEWGHDFRPDYRQLRPLADRFPGVPRIGLTATADAVTQADIAQQLGIAPDKVVVSGFDRPNIRYHVEQGRSRQAQLLRWLDARRGRAGIVYAPTRRKVEQLAGALQASGLNALPYHAGLDPQTRSGNQDAFVRADDMIMVATVAFGMGIDKPDVRFVAHMALPKSIEAYYQETGRAGRDGAPAEAIMWWGAADIARARSQIDENGEAGDRSRVDHQKLSALAAYASSAKCRRIALLGYFGEARTEACGNCDNCLDPPSVVDVSDDAIKLLSAVYRTGQRYGLGYLADVLAGNATDRALQNGHDRLGVFGLTADKSMMDWRPVQQQLAAEDALVADPQHGGLSLGPNARAILRGERTVEIVPPPPPRRQRRRGAADVSSTDDPLFQHLRALRKTLAEENSVPAYVIFHDATLAEMAAAKPASDEELARIGGVGSAKRDRYGAAFLAAIAEFTSG
ncbi:MAG: DNA helicase RecQ [Pacificimonas sp.]|jgi:ATP-dependent DNA helicase RecQ|nr:DNA helicase RecQ [Pacificimonas sp.]